MRRFVAAAAIVFSGLVPAQEPAWTGLGFVELGAASCDAPRSSADGGFGRLDCGEDGGSAVAQARFALLYEPNLYWRAQLHGLLRQRDGSNPGREFGLVEAFAERDWYTASGARLRVRLGQGFLATSRENVDPLWASPYTLTLSALNSWVAEEVRPIGTELSWRREFSQSGSIEAGIGATLGNDTSGALLAWRGFSLHQRLSVFGESVPTAPLSSLNPELDGGFALQRLYRTQPFGPDLDGRLGYTARLRLETGVGWRGLFTFADNRGDRGLHGDQYAWRTRFQIVGLEYDSGEPFTFAAELLRGHTQMGLHPEPFVDAEFRTGYVLGAWRFNEGWQLAARSERFRIDEKDFSSAERNDENGRAHTLALFHAPDAQWRVGLEYLRLRGRRPGLAIEPAATPDIGGTSLRFELRRSF